MSTFDQMDLQNESQITFHINFNNFCHLKILLVLFGFGLTSYHFLTLIVHQLKYNTQVLVCCVYRQKEVIKEWDGDKTITKRPIGENVR